MLSDRRVSVTSENRGPLLNVLTWILVVASVIVVTVKTSSKFLKTRSIQLDDAYILAATALAITIGVLANFQVSAGLGRHAEKLTEDDLAKLQKINYASSIFYTWTLCFTRLCVIALFDSLIQLGTYRHRKLVIKSVMLVGVVWTVICTIVLVFQCRPPDVWLVFGDRCVNHAAFWVTDGIMSIILDTFLATFPIYIVYGLQLGRRKKVVVVATFALRLVTLPVMIIRFVSILRVNSSNDHPYDDFLSALMTQAHLNSSIMASCIPFLKPFTDTLQTGLLTSDVHTILAGQSGSAHKMRPIKREKYSGSESNPSQDPKEPPAAKPQVHDNRQKINHNPLRSRTSSQESLIIQQTTTISVQIEQGAEGSKNVSRHPFQ